MGLKALANFIVLTPEQDKFKDFYFRNARGLYLFAEKKINDEDAARHIVDDAFIANQETILTKDEDTAMRWMYTTIKCDCIDFLRKHKTTPEKRMEYIRWAQRQPDYWEDEDMKRTELLQRLQHAIEKLSPREKEVIKALLKDGKAKEAAQKMGIAETSFSNTKRNALSKLLRLLGGTDAVILLLMRLLLTDDWKN
jgi:RNA polymerase sigma factor (sigma-70 family)